MSTLTYKGVVYTFGEHDIGCSACDLRKYCSIVSEKRVYENEDIAIVCREHIKKLKRSTVKFTPFHFEVSPLYTLLEELKSNDTENK